MSIQAPITLYTKNNCADCDRTKKFLAQRELEYTEFNVEEDPDALAYIKAMGYLAAPVVFVPFYEGQTTPHWSGLRPDLLVQIPN